MRTSVRTLEMARREHGQRRPAAGPRDHSSAFFFFCFTLIPALFGGVCEASSSHWSYTNEGGHGPSEWHKDFPICKAEFQSPVDLKGAVDTENLSELDLHGYDRVLKNAVLVNNGHTVKLTSKDSGAWLSGGCLGEHRYYFLQLHFHWGADNARGSEHYLNGKSFPMEAHFVHRNGKYDAVDAPNHPDGLAVLGVFYQISGTGLDEVKGLLNALRSLEQSGPGKEVKVDHSLTLRAMLPKDTRNFYCYHRGSLTTPPCNQAVNWTVLEDPAPISADQLGLFRRLVYENGKPMVDNFRPVQNLNGRTVFFHSSSAPGLPTTPLFLLLLPALLLHLSRQKHVIGG